MDFSARMKNKAAENFDNIKAAIEGIYEVLDLGLKEKDILCQAGKDNVLGLYKNLIELFLNDYGLRNLLKNLREEDFDISVRSNDMSIRQDI